MFTDEVVMCLISSHNLRFWFSFWTRKKNIMIVVYIYECRKKYKIPWFPILQIEQPFLSFSDLFLLFFLNSIDCWLISLPFLFFVNILLAIFFWTNSTMPPCSQQLFQPYKLTAYIKPVMRSKKIRLMFSQLPICLMRNLSTIGAYNTVKLVSLDILSDVG